MNDIQTKFYSFDAYTAMKGILCFLLIVLTGSCMYQFSDERNFVKQSAPVISNTAKITLSGVTDTVRISKTTKFTYAVSGLDLQILDVTFALDGKEFATNSTLSSGSINISPTLKTKKVTTLKVRVITRSGSNSLADVVGAEQVFYEQSWPTIIDTNGPAPVKITSAKSNKGMLLITWQKYKFDNFSAYVLSGTKSNQSVTINSADSTRYYDRNFVGGNASFFVRVIPTPDSPSNDEPSLVYAVTDTLRPRLVGTEMLANNKIKLNWTRGNYRANVKRFQVWAGDQSTYSLNPKIFTTTNPLDTTLTVDGTFGQRFYFHLGTSSTTNPDGNNYDVLSTSFYQYGESVSPYSEIRFSTQNRYFSMNQNTLSAFRTDNRQLVSSYPITTSNNIRNFIEVSPSGDRLIRLFNRVVTVYNASDFQIASQFSVADQIASDDNVVSMAISHGNKLYITRTRLVQSGSNTIAKPAFVVYDLSTQSYVRTIDNDSPTGLGTFITAGRSFFSTDDQYLFFRPAPNDNFGAWNKFANDNLVNSSSSGNPAIDPQDPSQVIFARSDGKIFKVETATGNPIPLYNELPGFGLIEFHPELNSVLGYKDNNVVLFDYVNQQVVFSVKACACDFDFDGNYIFSQSGARLRIN